MSLGADIAERVRLCYINKEPVPKTITDAPELLPWLSPIWASFYELGTCRQSGFDEGLIPWTAIHHYAVVNGYGDPFEFERFLILIRAMDEAYIEFKQKKQKNKAIGNKTPGKTKGHIRIKGEQ